MATITEIRDEVARDRERAADRASRALQRLAEQVQQAQGEVQAMGRGESASPSRAQLSHQTVQEVQTYIADLSTLWSAVGTIELGMEDDS